MRHLILSLLLISFYPSFAQNVPESIDSALNAMKVKKSVYKDVQPFPLFKAPAHISGTGIKMFTDTLMLFSFAPQELIENSKQDSSLLKRNKTYQYYSAGVHGNCRGFYYHGKFTLVEQHTAQPETDSADWNKALIYLDTSIMIITRLHRYLVTEWRPYNTENPANYHNLNIIFIFDKSGKLINHFTYDNYKLPVLTSVGFFNRDDLLDVVFYDKTETVNGQTNWHFKLYSLDKKGKTKESTFYKGGRSVIITAPQN